MISVGIDVSKGKSTVCILKPYGEIVCSPFEMQHVEKELEGLDSILQKLDGEVRIVMEATGIYHLPVLTYLSEKGYFVSVVNPFVMKTFAKDNNFRGVKTDKLDSIMIANYGIEKWFKLQKYEGDEEVYAELKLLGRRYRYYMELHVKALLELTHILDYVMPGIKKKFNSWNEANNKDKLSDFVEKFWHYDMITSMSLEEFIEEYLLWAKEKKYHRSRSKAEEVYELASGGIPTLSSSTPSTKMLVQEAVSVLRAVDSSLATILARMQLLAKSLPEYSTVREMGGVGDVLAPKLIAEIGDVRKLHSAKALIACAGIDPPPYESGQFVGTNRRMTKRGSATLRKFQVRSNSLIQNTTGICGHRPQMLIVIVTVSMENKSRNLWKTTCRLHRVNFKHKYIRSHNFTSQKYNRQMIFIIIWRFIVITFLTSSHFTTLNQSPAEMLNFLGFFRFYSIAFQNLLEARI